MDFDPSVLQQLIEAFNYELDENLQLISEKILFLETSDKSSKDSSSAINDLFRAFHTIKGSSHAVGLLNIASLSHNLEDLYSIIKKSPEKIDSRLIDLTLEVASEMKKSFDYYQENNNDDYNLNEIIDKTNTVLKSYLKDNSVNNNSEEEIINNKNTNKKIKVYRKTNPNNKKEQNSNTDINSTINSTKLTFDNNEQLKVPYSKIINISALGDELKNILIEINDDFFNYEYKIQNFYTGLKKLINEFYKHIKDDSIAREDFSKITSEIDLSFSEFFDFANETRENSSRLNLNLDVLRDSFQELSLVSISILTNTLQVIVRELAKKFKKIIKLNVIGDDIKIDRNVLEKIKDPLIHIIRNAIDHGIENPEKRKKLGKPDIGQIIVNISHHSGRGVITIEDDGSGIDIDEVKNTALNNKIILTVELDRMDEQEVLKLIFKPGYTSKEEVTEISGRGVGLDIVANNISLIKGKYNLETKKDVGTKFILDLPLSLATENGIIIKVNEQKFVIPALTIKKIIEVNIKDLQTLESEKVVILNNQPIPLYDLNHILNLGDNNKRNFVNNKIVLIISVPNEPEIGLIVDDVINQREVIVKALSEPLNQISCISGIATIGKEGLLVVLNTPEIVKMALSTVQQITSDEKKYRDNEEEIFKEMPNNISNKIKILVVDDSITTRTSLTNALKIKNFDIITSNNGKEAWELMKNKKFDLVITDIMMPVMDGFELTKKIKSSEDHLHIPVVIVSSLAKDEDRKKGIEVGANAYLVKKHFENRELINIVSELLVT